MWASFIIYLVHEFVRIVVSDCATMMAIGYYQDDALMGHAFVSTW